jgi:hypothetical protein
MDGLGRFGVTMFLNKRLIMRELSRRLGGGLSRCLMGFGVKDGEDARLGTL